MMKTKSNSDVTDRTNVVYAENETELSRSIGLGVVFNKNQIGQ